MTCRNRMTPYGERVAAPGRGTLMGNRGSTTPPGEPVRGPRSGDAVVLTPPTSLTTLDGGYLDGEAAGRRLLAMETS